MGHSISGFVADSDILKDFSANRGLHPPVVLVEGLAFLPLSDDHLDQLVPEHGALVPGANYLSEGLQSLLSQESAATRIAYIETEYFGGAGGQLATVYDHGECLLAPLKDGISDALSLLGASRAGDSDEFTAAGLGRFRSNEAWIAAGKSDDAFPANADD